MATASPVAFSSGIRWNLPLPPGLGRVASWSARSYRADRSADHDPIKASALLPASEVGRNETL